MPVTFINSISLSPSINYKFVSMSFSFTHTLCLLLTKWCHEQQLRFPNCIILIIGKKTARANLKSVSHNVTITDWTTYYLVLKKWTAFNAETYWKCMFICFVFMTDTWVLNPLSTYFMKLWIFYSTSSAKFKYWWRYQIATECGFLRRTNMNFSLKATCCVKGYVCIKCR